MSTSLRTFLAQEYAAAGQNDLALSHARTCVQEAEADPNLANGASLLAECRAPSPASRPRPHRRRHGHRRLPRRPSRRARSCASPRRRPSWTLRDPLPEAPRASGPGAGPWAERASARRRSRRRGRVHALREGATDERNAACTPARARSARPCPERQSAFPSGHRRPGSCGHVQRPHQRGDRRRRGRGGRRSPVVRPRSSGHERSPRHRAHGDPPRRRRVPRAPGRLVMSR